MDSREEKQFHVVAERVIDMICLAISYGLLFLLPETVDFFFYLLFGISAFMFCIGFFRLGFTFNTPADGKGKLLTLLLLILLGAVGNMIGLYTLYLSQGTGRSICIATILLIEALLLYAIAGSKAEAPGAQWRVSIIFRIAAVLLVCAGIFLAIREHFSETVIILGTMLLIEAICLWVIGSGNNPFNTMTSKIQTVPKMKTPIRQLHRDFSKVETQLGYPWIGKIRTIKKDSLIYGPLDDGFFVCCYYHFGQFYVAGSENPFFPLPEDAEPHIVKETPDSKGILLARENLPEAYACMFTRYVERGNTAWSTDLENRMKKPETKEQ